MNRDSTHSLIRPVPNPFCSAAHYLINMLQISWTSHRGENWKRQPPINLLCLNQDCANYWDRCECVFTCAWSVRKYVSFFEHVPLLPEHSHLAQNILTVPFTHPWGSFIAPMTKRSILQNQRCQPPLFKETIRRRVRWEGWTMLEMTVTSLSLPCSPTFSFYNSQCRAV